MGRLRSFNRSVAAVVGINAYGDGIPTLETAVADAKAMAKLLEEQHGYTVELRIDSEASAARLKVLFEDELPRLVGPDDRLLVYFAGHGTAQDGDDGPQGFLLPQDARSGADARPTLLSMAWLHRCVSALPCRHRLLMLDCCFAGTFRWAAHRSFFPHGQTVYRHRYARFVDEPAAQVLTSAAADQKAIDVIDGMTLGLRARSTPQGHSPFATAVLAGLAGAADMPGVDGVPDGVITATELYVWVREVVERTSEARGLSQTPGLWPLPMHGRGEYLFEVPGRPLRLTEDPRLDEDANPWRGLHPYGGGHQALFFGRDAEIAKVLERLDKGTPLIAVLGASGTGKSSLIGAGVLPRLGTEWAVVGPTRPGRSPLAVLERAEAGLTSAASAAAARKVLVIDQLEELFTLACPANERTAFIDRIVALSNQPGLSVIVSLRSDFEAALADTALAKPVDAGRYVLPPMTRDGLRAVIRGPAELRVLYFEPPELPERLIDEVVALPGGLPLLSFTLAEMYRSYLARDAGDRALRAADYVALGGVIGSLRSRASAIYDAADRAEQQTIRRLMLRLVATESAELARRRATLAELAYPDAEENARMSRVIDRLVLGRLLVRSTTATDDDGSGEAYVEPVHDALVLGWDRVYRWRRAAAEHLPLMRAVWQSARTWSTSADAPGLLWTRDPRLPQARVIVDELNALERRFVTQSLQRRRRGWWTLAGAVLAVMLALGGVAVYALGQARRADANAATAESRGRIAEKARADADRSAASAVSSAQLARAREEDAIEARKLADESAQLAKTREQDAVAASKRAQALQLRAEDAARFSVAQQVRDADPTTAALVLTEINDPERSTYLLRTLLELAIRPGHLRADLEGHTKPISAAHFSPDSARIVTASNDNTARVWDADGRGTPVVFAGHTKRIHAVAFSPDGRQIVTASEDHTARVWNADGTGTPIILRGHTGPVVSVAFSSDGTRVVTGSWDGTARVWKRDGATPSVVLRGHTKHVASAAFSPDGQRVVTASWDKTVRIWNADGSGSAVVLKGHPRAVDRAAFGPKGARVISVDLGGARIWNVAGGGPPIVLPGHGEFLRSAAFSPDGGRVVTTSQAKIARIWSADGAGDPIVLNGHTGYLQSAVFDAEGERIVTASGDGTVRIWRADGAGAPVVLGVEQPANRASYAAFSPDGSRIVSVHGDAARVWNIAGVTPIVLEGHTELVQSAAFSADGARVATASADTTARVWRADGAGDPVVLAGHTKPLRTAAFSPDGARVVTASGDTTARVWRADGTGAPIVLAGHTKWVRSAVFSPDGARIVTASNDSTARVWRADGSGTPIVLKGHRHGVGVAAFSPDGTHVVTGSADNTARIWRADGTGTPITLEGHTFSIHTVAFSPDGTEVLTASADHSARIWSADGTRSTPFGQAMDFRTATLSPDRARVVSRSHLRPPHVLNVDGTGAPLVLTGHTGEVHAAAFSADGKRVVTASADKTARIWDIDGRTLQALLDKHIRRCLPQAFRVERLGETPETAQARHDACRARKGLAPRGAR